MSVNALLLRLYRGAEYCDQLVCLSLCMSVCLSASISLEPLDRSSRNFACRSPVGLSHRDSYTVRIGGCLELYYCNMVEWFWWDSSLIFDDQLVSFSALTLLVWSLACKNRPQNDL